MEISLERDLEKVSHHWRLTNYTSGKDTLERYMESILPFRGSVSTLSTHQGGSTSPLTWWLCSVAFARPDTPVQAREEVLELSNCLPMAQTFPLAGETE